MTGRLLVVDTETTGLDPKKGERMIEIACVEISRGLILPRAFHHYVNPGKPVGESFEIHRLSDAFLRDKPPFAQIAPSLCRFVNGADLVFHNAPFDMGFLHAEFSRLRKAGFAPGKIIDTLEMAREKYPNSPNNLDALCRRLKIDLSPRAQAHGALIDARLLAQAYLEMTRGEQASLSLAAPRPAPPGAAAEKAAAHILPPARPPRLVAVSPEAAQAHQKLLSRLEAKMDGKPLWKH